MSTFYQFIHGPIYRGDRDETVSMWKDEYKDERYMGWTALHYACEYLDGDREGVVHVLLDGGCDIEAEAGRTVLVGWRPIHFCASNGNERVMRALVDSGCCLTALTPDGETPLQIAQRCKHVECVAILSIYPQDTGCTSPRPVRLASRWNVLRTDLPKHVAQYKVSDLLDLLKNNNLTKIVKPETGETLLDILLNNKDQRILDAIKVKQVNQQEMEDWMSLGRYPASIQSIQSIQSLNECLMYRCIHQNRDHTVYTLCTADIVNRPSLFFGPTALETAVTCGSVVWVHEILRKLVKVDESWPIAEDMAKKANFLYIEKMISKRREYLDRKHEKGLSRLHIAVIENDPDMVEYLIKKGLVTADESHKNLGSALSLAYNVDHIDCVKSLQACNVNVNTVDRFMQTPLHVAIANKTEDLSEYLVNNTKDIENMDIFMLTAMARSILNDCMGICEKLVRKGAECDKDIELPPQLFDVDPDFRMISSDIPIIPITNQETIYTLCLKSNRTIYPFLLESIDHLSVNRTDRNKNTLLHLSAVYLMPDLCFQLISNSADINSKNDSGSTPLLELLKRNCERNIKEVTTIETILIETVNILIDGGASLDVDDSDGCSVLEKATVFNNEKLLLALIHKDEHIDQIKKDLWLAWIYKKHFTMLEKVIPLINKPLQHEWITRDLIKDRLADDNISLAKTMYDHGSSEVKIDVVETMLHKAAIIDNKDLFKNIIIDDIASNSSLDGGESLMNYLIRERKIEFIQLIIRSRHGRWFVEKTGTENKFPLHVCIENDYWEVMNQLIVHTSSVNKQDNNGNTAVSLLLTKISNSDDEIIIGQIMAYVQLLIIKSADIYLVNRLNETVINYCTNSDLKLEIESFFRIYQPPQQ